MGNPSTINLFRDLSECFSALADSYRQDILILLTDNSEMNVNQIASRIDLSRPAISHHLKILRQANLVDSEKRGTENYYYLTIKTSLNQIEKLIASMKKECEIR